MHAMLKKLMEKKGQSKMNPEEKEVKVCLLKDLIKDMDGMMLEPLKKLKKVTVAANDEEGLEEGLDKAKDLLKQMPKMKDESEDEEELLEESEDNEENDEDLEDEKEDSEEDMSLDKIEAELKKLEELKKKKMGM